ncbi:LicD family protein [Methanosphaera sp. Vir-13MRS]|uniref:LicD family protein n=1 Tax=Candidatus Methanosphaera massiliense TaxID=3017187 RepID=UPI0023801230|nr:LicD family protein [Candidatus Methanosphaera massiliense]MDE4078019.1 LicD family protein [Candidatus Methanosphaera massiliense]
MVPVLSKLYQILPESIKNHPRMIELVQRFNNNNKFREIDSHYKMLDMIFASCDIKATGVMRQIQLLSLELLKLFDNICNKYDLEYWLDYGTLLGAVRHGGFVPWDDDIDIGMIREDYDKFVEIFPQEIEKLDSIKDNIIISKLTRPHDNLEDTNELDALNNNTFILFFQCAYKKPFVHFDVFPKEYIKDEGLTPERNNLETELQVELRNKIESGDWTFEEGLEVQRNKMKFCDERTNQISDAVDGLHNNIHNRIYKTEYVFPLKKIRFEHYEFSCPNNYKKYLPLIYGPEYMHIPRIALDHNTTGFVKNQFNNNEEEINQGFEEAIQKLKDINENFR